MLERLIVNVRPEPFATVAVVVALAALLWVALRAHPAGRRTGVHMAIDGLVSVVLPVRCRVVVVTAVRPAAGLGVVTVPLLTAAALSIAAAIARSSGGLPTLIPPWAQAAGRPR